MEASEPLWLFVTPLNRYGIHYAVTGATAAILYGAPRLTNDLDLVLDLSRDAARRLPQLFPLGEFYLPPEDALEVERVRPNRGHFNIIHLGTGYKADVYLAGADLLHRWALDHRRQITLVGGDIHVAPPEYVIIRKLEFYHEGRSEKHLHDVRAILESSGSDLDWEVLKREIGNRGLVDLWQTISGVENQ